MLVFVPALSLLYPLRISSTRSAISLSVLTKFGHTLIVIRQSPQARGAGLPACLNTGLRLGDIVPTPDDQRHPLVQFRRFDIPNPLRPRTGFSTGLFDDQGQRIRFIEKPN